MKALGNLPTAFANRPKRDVAWRLARLALKCFGRQAKRRPQVHLATCQPLLPTAARRSL
jgi:hypothetical protein